MDLRHEIELNLSENIIITRTAHYDLDDRRPAALNDESGGQLVHEMFLLILFATRTG